MLLSGLLHLLKPARRARTAPGLFRVNDSCSLGSPPGAPGFSGLHIRPGFLHGFLLAPNTGTPRSGVLSGGREEHFPCPDGRPQPRPRGRLTSPGNETPGGLPLETREWASPGIRPALAGEITQGVEGSRGVTANWSGSPWELGHHRSAGTPPGCSHRVPPEPFSTRGYVPWNEPRNCCRAWGSTGLTRCPSKPAS